MSSSVHTHEIRPYNTKELAHLYKVNARTLARWLSPHQSAIGERRGYYYTIPQIIIIFEKLGLPSLVND